MNAQARALAQSQCYGNGNVAKMSLLLGMATGTRAQPWPTGGFVSPGDPGRGCHDLAGAEMRRDRMKSGPRVSRIMSGMSR